ncbi:IS3 family transposase, partial [Allochromatium palmeri]|uniref:IS3 family transposase n=1 Tax=Allochromatium palmeri TaxID=231048 RepID=UPI003CCE205D
MSARRTWIEPEGEVAVSRQCTLAGIARSGVYRASSEEGVSALDQILLALIDAEYTRHPFYGSRRLVVFLNGQGHGVNRKRVQRLMRILGLAGMAP